MHFANQKIFCSQKKTIPLLTILLTPQVWGFSTPSNSPTLYRYQVSVIQLNSILRLTAWDSCSSHRWRARSHKTAAVSVTNMELDLLNIWPASYKLGVSVTVKSWALPPDKAPDSRERSKKKAVSALSQRVEDRGLSPKFCLAQDHKGGQFPDSAVARQALEWSLILAGINSLVWFQWCPQVTGCSWFPQA